MIRALERMLKTERLLAEDDPLVIGVSGGADSVALVHLLLELNRHCGWRLRLHMSHLNHGLRGREADDDEAFVKQLASDLALPCATDRRDVVALAASKSLTIEEAGRAERYAFFERVCLQSGSSTVAVAHHADDQAETVLHRVLRGTGLRGLAGMPRSRSLQRGSRVRLIRPLLHVPRDELRQYLKRRKLPYRHDRSNESAEPTRNWIRLHLLPLIRAELNQKVDAALIRLANQAADLRATTDDLVNRTLETIILDRSESRLSLNAAALARKSRFLQAAVVAGVCREMGVREKRISAIHVEHILSLIADPGHVGPVSLPGRWRFHRVGDELILDKERFENQIPSRPAPVYLAAPGTTHVPCLRILVTIELMDRSDSEHPRIAACALPPFIQDVDVDSLRPPMLVRTRLPGDRFQPLGASGQKSLSDFFIDQKVDRGDRDLVPIICDQSGVVWVVGHRIADRVKLTTGTRRILRIEVSACER